MTTLTILGALLAVWVAFGVLTAAIRRRKLRGEHPGVGERPAAPVVRRDQAPRQSWKQGRRPWH